MKTHATPFGKGSVLAGGNTAGSNFTSIHHDRRVSVRSVPCPTCKAEVGQPCVSPTGKKAQHPVRRRMALRAETESYSVADVAYVASLKPGARKELRRRLGLAQPALAAHLGIPYSRLVRWESGALRASGPEGALYGQWLRKQMGEAS